MKHGELVFQKIYGDNKEIFKINILSREDCPDAGIIGKIGGHLYKDGYFVDINEIINIVQKEGWEYVTYSTPLINKLIG